MPEFKGTKGKWNTEGVLKGKTDNITVKKEGVLIGVYDEFGKAIALLGRKDSLEVLANAKLIAAAPELLEALQWAGAFGKNGKSHDKMIVDKCLEAIKKATE